MSPDTRITLKRVGLYFAIGLSVLGMILGPAAVVGVWIANAPITQTALAVLAPVGQALTQAELLADEAARLMSGVTETTGAVRERVDAAGAEVASADRTLTTIADIAAVRVGPAIDLLRSGGVFVQEAAEGIEQAVSRLDGLPLINVELPAAGKLRQVQQDVDAVVGDLELLKSAATAGNAGPLSTAFSLVTTPITELDRGVRAAQAAVEKLQGQVTEANATVGLILKRLPAWIDRVSAALTFFFVWFALSQIAVFKLSRRALAELGQ
jgi:hypothetical protein